MKKILAIIISLVIGFGGGFFAAYTYLNNNGDEGEGYDFKILSEQITEISELASLEYTYKAEMPYKGKTKDIFKKPEGFFNKLGINVFSNDMTIAYEGTMKFGVDMSEFTEKDITIDKENKTITAKIPHSKLLSHEINEDSWMITEEKNGMFNKLEPSDDASARKQAKEQALETEKIDKLIAKADTKTQKQIKKFLELSCPKMEVNVEFK